MQALHNEFLHIPNQIYSKGSVVNRRHSGKLLSWEYKILMFFIIAYGQMSNVKRTSNYIFILDLTADLNRLCKDNGDISCDYLMSDVQFVIVVYINVWLSYAEAMKS